MICPACGDGNPDACVGNRHWTYCDSQRPVVPSAIRRAERMSTEMLLKRRLAQLMEQLDCADACLEELGAAEFMAERWGPGV